VKGGERRGLKKRVTSILLVERGERGFTLSRGEGGGGGRKKDPEKRKLHPFSSRTRERKGEKEGRNSILGEQEREGNCLGQGGRPVPKRRKES